MDITKLLEELKENLNKRIKALEGQATEAKTAKEQLAEHEALLRRVGEVPDGDATLAELVASDGKLLKEMRETVERFTKQLPDLAGGKASERDGEYEGAIWPNAERAAQFGRFVLASIHQNGDLRRSCAEQVVKSGVRLRTTKGQFAKGEDYVKAMGESADSAGGYLVPDEFVSTLLRWVNEYGVARSRLRKVPMSRQVQSWPKRLGGLTTYYPDEGVPLTASDISFGKVTLTAKKWAVLTLVSKELEEDSAVALGELIAMEMALTLAMAEDTNTFMGDGTSAYGGVTGVLGSANVAVVTMPAAKTGFADVTHNDLVALKFAVPAWVRKLPDCGYYMCSGITGIVEQLADSNGRPLYNQPTEGHPLRIGGKEVVETEVMPDTDASAAGTKFIAFGSLWAWGFLGQRRGLTIERSDQVKWLEDQIAIKAVPRQDIQEAEGTAMAVLKTAAE